MAQITISESQLESIIKTALAEHQSAGGGDYLTSAEAAAMLKCTRVHIWKLRKQGLLRTFKVGPTKILLSRHDINQLLTSGNAMDSIQGEASHG